MRVNTRKTLLTVLLLEAFLLIGFVGVIKREGLDFEAAPKGSSITNTVTVQYCTEGDVLAVCDPENGIYPQSGSSTNKIYSSSSKGGRK